MNTGAPVWIAATSEGEGWGRKPLPNYRCPVCGDDRVRWATPLYARCRSCDWEYEIVREEETGE